MSESARDSCLRLLRPAQLQWGGGVELLSDSYDR
jgi:hypothetical protein